MNIYKTNKKWKEKKNDNWITQIFRRPSNNKSELNFIERTLAFYVIEEYNESKKFRCC